MATGSLLPPVVNNAGGASLTRPYLLSAPIAKGQPLEIWNDAGTAKIRPIVQSIPGITISSNYFNIVNGNANWRGGIVHNWATSGVGTISTCWITDASTNQLQVASATIAANLSLSNIATNTLTGWPANTYDWVRSYSNGGLSSGTITVVAKISGSNWNFGSFGINTATGAPTTSTISMAGIFGPSATDVELCAAGGVNRMLLILGDGSSATIRYYTPGTNTVAGSFVTPGNNTGGAVNIKYVDQSGTVVRFIYAKSISGGTQVGLGTYDYSNDTINVISSGTITQTCTIKGMAVLGTLSTSSDVWVAMPDASSGSCHAIRILSGGGAVSYQTSFSTSSGSVFPSQHYIVNHAPLDQFKVLAFVQDGSNPQSWQRSEILFNTTTLTAIQNVAPAILLGGGAFSTPAQQFFPKDGPRTGATAAFLKFHANSPTGGNNNYPIGAVGTGTNVNVLGVYAGLAFESGTTGETKQIALNGGVVDGLAGFNSPGQRVYIDANTGNLTTTNTGYLAGRVLGAGEVQAVTP